MGEILQNRPEKKKSGRKPAPEPRYEYHIDETETEALDRLFADLFRKVEQELQGDTL